MDHATIGLLITIAPTVLIIWSWTSHKGSSTNPKS
jgi:hypothetical protein